MYNKKINVPEEIENLKSWNTAARSTPCRYRGRYAVGVSIVLLLASGRDWIWLLLAIFFTHWQALPLTSVSQRSITALPWSSGGELFLSHLLARQLEVSAQSWPGFCHHSMSTLQNIINLMRVHCILCGFHHQYVRFFFPAWGVPFHNVLIIILLCPGRWLTDLRLRLRLGHTARGATFKVLNKRSVA